MRAGMKVNEPAPLVALAALVGLAGVVLATGVSASTPAVAPAVTVSPPVAIAAVNLTGWSATLDGAPVLGITDVGDSCPLAASMQSGSGTTGQTPGPGTPACASRVTLKRLDPGDAVLSGWASAKTGKTLIVKRVVPVHSADGGLSLATSVWTYSDATPVSLSVTSPDGGRKVETLAFVFRAVTHTSS